MKRYNFPMAVVLLLSTFGMQSCLDFDTPVDDLKQNEVKIDDVVLSGKADHLDYMRDFTQQGVDDALNKLSVYVDMTKTGQYAMRGGKDGGFPTSHAYQRQFTLTDVYAQYAVVPHHDFAFATELVSSYNVSKDWNSGPNGSFLLVKNSFVPLLNHPSVDSIPELKAIVLLLLDYACIEEADIYGPFPYKDFKANKEKSPFTYDKVDQIYKSVKANLDTIVDCLRYYDNRPEWYKERVQTLLYDKMYVNNDAINGIEGFDTWIRLANSLKLRMAMHIVKVEPELARKWAEDAVASGVVESHLQESGFFPSDYGGSNPLLEISKTWGDERVSASFVSLVKSLGHPYESMLLTNNDGELVNTKTNEVTPPNSMVVGIRSGVHTGKGQSGASNPFLYYTQLFNMTIDKMPLYLMKWSEVDFLRAEGALRGWNMGGTAQSFYERGIQNSSPFSSDVTMAYDEMLAEYMNVDAPNAYTYHDPLGNTPDIESVTKIGVKWNEADDRETKLEKIITQKYLAGFPYSFEAWTDMRRTGYPKVFPVLNVNDGDGSLKDGDLVRRMLFASDDEGAIKDIQDTGLDALGGPDQQATRLWWDKDAPNF